MEYNIDDYAKLEAPRSPVYGWTLDTVRKYSNDELDTMHRYFYDNRIFVAVALNTFKDLVHEHDALVKRVTELEKRYSSSSSS